MNTAISAIYQHGAFHPLEPLTLPESTLVQVQVVNKGSVSPRSDTLSQIEHYTARLRASLPQLTRKWSETLVQQTVAKLFQDDLQTLWYLCQPTQRELCTMLMLATQTIHTDTPLPQQIETIDWILKQIEQDNLSEDEVEACHEKLLAAGLYLSFSLSNEAVQSYKIYKRLWAKQRAGR